MDDLLELHAARVGDSNKAHEQALQNVVDTAAQAFDAALVEFEDKLAASVKIATEACQDMLAALKRIVVDARTEAATAFAGNLADVAASGARTAIEMNARTTFLTTGKLPEPPAPAALPPPAAQQEQPRSAPVDDEMQHSAAGLED